MGMKLKPKSSAGGDFEIVPAGSHPAVLVGLVDLGTQRNDYQGQVRYAEQVYLVWEIPGEKKADGTSHVIGKVFTKSLHEKAGLRNVIEKWRGKSIGADEEFDLTKTLGKTCMLAVVHKTSANGENEYAKMDGVQAMPKGVQCEKPTREPYCFDIEDNGDISRVPEWLPYIYGRPVKDVIQEAEEWKARDTHVGNGKNGQTVSKDLQPAEKEEGEDIPW